MGAPEPAVVAVELANGGELRLRWPVTPPNGSGELAWKLESEPDWRRLAGVGLISAQFEDGTALGVASVRPRDARGHGDDAVIVRLVDGEGSDTPIDEAFVSVEYDGSGDPGRLGLELWPESDSAPLRVAADRDSEPDSASGGGPIAVRMSFRLDGVEGTGRFERLSGD